MRLDDYYNRRYSCPLCLAKKEEIKAERETVKRRPKRRPKVFVSKPF